MIYDFATDRARVAFMNRDGARVIERRGLLTIVFENLLVVRFKKLRPNLKTYGIPTLQQQLFQSQQEIPGLPPRATYLVAGYLLDRSGTEIDHLLITCSDETGVLWVEPLDNNLGRQVIAIPTPQHSPSLPKLRSKILRLPRKEAE